VSAGSHANADEKCSANYCIFCLTRARRAELERVIWRTGPGTDELKDPGRRVISVGNILGWLEKINCQILEYVPSSVGLITEIDVREGK
jgi:hypothetical protein